MKIITDEIIESLEIDEEFSTKDAYSFVTSTDKKHSIRARLHEGIKNGIFKRISRGVYTLIDKDKNTVLMVQGDGRDLSMIQDKSIDCIITDHPYSDEKSNSGGNRKFANYNTFKYNQEDFNEKARVLKDGSYLVEFFAEENSNNYEYIYECKQFAKNAGLNYYTSVDWKKGDFVANTGRKAKNKEQMVFFTKGESRSLKTDAKKNLKTLRDNNLIDKNKTIDSRLAVNLIKEKNLKISFMKGTSKMLPVEFNVNKTPKNQTIHQAEKPIDLFTQLIEYITLENEMILDQFAGSGNLGVACLIAKRNAILIEKDKETYENGKENISGKTA